MKLGVAVAVTWATVIFAVAPALADTQKTSPADGPPLAASKAASAPPTAAAPVALPAKKPVAAAAKEPVRRVIRSDPTPLKPPPPSLGLCDGS